MFRNVSKREVPSRRASRAVEIAAASSDECRYDPVGNRRTNWSDDTMTEHLVNGLNQITTIKPAFGGSSAATHDAAGNMTGDGTWSYRWDGDNMLRSVEDASFRYEFTYDGLKRKVRAKKYNKPSTIPASDTIYVYDGWNCVAEIDTIRDKVTKSYVWGLDLSGTLDGAGGVGGLLSVTTHGTPDNTYFYFCDGNGNVVDMVDVNIGGAGVAAHYEYDPFGRTVLAEGTYAEANEYRFSTKRFVDAAGGLYDYGYRHYSPDLGRWLSRDPIGEKDGANLYRMGKNNLQDNYDMFGLKCCGPDITDPLNATLGGVQIDFANWGPDVRWKHCINMTRYPSVGGGWDIQQLNVIGKGGASYSTVLGVLGTSPYERTVSVNGKCYDAQAVNYMLWGLIHRLCHDEFDPIYMAPGRATGSTVYYVNRHYDSYEKNTLADNVYLIDKAPTINPSTSSILKVDMWSKSAANNRAWWAKAIRPWIWGGEGWNQALVCTKSGYDRAHPTVKSYTKAIVTKNKGHMPVYDVTWNAE